MRTKSRLHRLETIIRPPTALELTDDERAVWAMLVFTRRFLPHLLADSEAWHAAGCPSAPPSAGKETAAATCQRIDRLTPALLAANARTNELAEQGRLSAIVDRLTAWGLWREPGPPPPDVAIIIDRLRKLWDETN